MAEKIRDLVCGMEFDEDTASGYSNTMARFIIFVA